MDRLRPHEQAQPMSYDIKYPDSKVHWANMGPTWVWQDPGGPHVGPMNLAIWVVIVKDRLNKVYSMHGHIL